MTGLVICNGTISDYSAYGRYLKSADLIICADGGADHAKGLGVTPGVLLGDFDSVSPETLERYKSLGTEIIRFRPEKDATDTELAVELAMDRGADSIVIIGGMGTRFDHTLANVLLLKKMYDRGVKGLIVNEFNEITVTGGRIRLEKEKEKDLKVTLLPLTPAVEGVCTTGLYYPLDHATLDMGTTRGVSNEFSGDEAQVTVSKGLLLVIKARE